MDQNFEDDLYYQVSESHIKNNQQIQYSSVFATRFKKWTFQEDNLLKQTYEKYPNNWIKIGEILGRESTVCSQRFAGISKKWNPHQDKYLLFLSYTYRFNWGDIAKILINQKKGFIAQTRYRQLMGLNQIPTKTVWTKHQDNQLKQLFRNNQQKWAKIAQEFENCNPSSCYLRMKRFFKKQSFGLWTTREEKILKKIYNEKRNVQKKLQKYFPRHTKSSCVKKYKSLIQKKQEFCWTEEEDNLLRDLYKKFPCDWQKIVKRFTKKTKEACFRRHQLLRKSDKRERLRRQKESYETSQEQDNFSQNMENQEQVSQKSFQQQQQLAEHNLHFFENKFYANILEEINALVNAFKNK